MTENNMNAKKEANEEVIAVSQVGEEVGSDKWYEAY